jgi:hypothetical protein
MVTVKFNDVDEFVANLRQDADLVERKLVRLTFRHKAADPTLPIRSMSLVASAVVGGQVVTLLTDCGSYMQGSADEHGQVAAAARAAAGKVEAVARELGLEVRPGVIEA